MLLHGVGFLLCLRGIYKEKLRVFSPYIHVGYLSFLLAILAVGLVVENQRFTQIDNFTHWATVVRSMFRTDRFPTFQDSVVQFTSYPLGSSALAYFICKLTGEAECMQMWAQAYLMLCTLLPVFACCPKNKGAYLALTVVMTGFLLHYNIPITELLVDTLTPLAGMAAAWFICFHYGQRDEKPELSPFYAIPLLVWTMNIKHSALIFVAFGMVLLYLCIQKREQGRKQWALIAGAVLFANLLWSRHCDYVFAGAAASRHSLSFDWFRTILGDKTTEGILNTVRMVLVQAVTRTECLWLGAWFVLLGALVWFAVREEKKRCRMVLLSALSLYVVYTMGILAMYVFSMEEYETLLAFTRYMRSIDVAIYYLLTLFSGLVLSKLGKLSHAAAVSLVLVLLTAAGWRFQTGEYLKEPLARCPAQWRQELEWPITEYGLQSGKRYLLCVNEGHSGWPRRIWRYNLQTDAVDQKIVTEESQLEILEEYDYVVILDTGNPLLEAWVRENYPDAAGSTVIRRCA